jgi:hypothetical protein
MNKIYEKDLYLPIREFFISQGFEVRGEVEHCDLCAIKNDEVVVVELKKNLSVELLVQAANRQKIADLVYVAIPKPKKLKMNSKWKDICHLLRRLEIGLILVDFSINKYVEVIVQPEPFDRVKSIQRNKRKRSKLVEEFKGRHQDLNIGGSRGTQLMTAYRENALYIACCIDSLGPMSAKQIRKYGSDEKKTYSILYQNHYGWFYKVSDGIYDLTDKGKQDILVYKELSDNIKERINEKKEIYQVRVVKE